MLHSTWDKNYMLRPHSVKNHTFTKQIDIFGVSPPDITSFFIFLPLPVIIKKLRQCCFIKTVEPLEKGPELIPS